MPTGPILLDPMDPITKRFFANEIIWWLFSIEHTEPSSTHWTMDPMCTLNKLIVTTRPNGDIGEIGLNGNINGHIVSVAPNEHI